MSLHLCPLTNALQLADPLSIYLITLAFMGFDTELRDFCDLGKTNGAAEIDYPVEAVVEMALAGYLDREAIALVDCKPERGKG